MSKQIVILGFDGLEYNLGERFKLLSLKQKYYGKVQIPPECYEKKRIWQAMFCMNRAPYVIFRPGTIVEPRGRCFPNRLV